MAIWRMFREAGLFGHPLGGRVGGGFHARSGGSVKRLIMVWRLRIRSRRDLARLDDDQLRDIGVSREAARLEADKAFWTP